MKAEFYGGIIPEVVDFKSGGRLASRRLLFSTFENSR